MSNKFPNDAFAQIVSKCDNLEMNFDQKLGGELLDHLKIFQKHLEAPHYKKAIEALHIFIQSDPTDPSRCFEDWREALDQVRALIKHYHRK